MLRLVHLHYCDLTRVNVLSSKKYYKNYIDRIMTNNMIHIILNMTINSAEYIENNIMLQSSLIDEWYKYEYFLSYSKARSTYFNVFSLLS